MESDTFITVFFGASVQSFGGVESYLQNDLTPCVLIFVQTPILLGPVHTFKLKTRQTYHRSTVFHLLK